MSKHRTMMFRFIAASKADVSVSKACRLFGVSQSGFHAWKNRPASQRQRQDMILLAHIRNAFALSNETYGSPRMTVDFQEEGFAIGRRRVARLMRFNGLQARRVLNARPTAITPGQSRRTFSIETSPLWPQTANGPWTSATCGQPKGGVALAAKASPSVLLTLAIVMDLFSRRIVGWSTSDRLKRDLALEALRRAVALRRPRPDLAHHSDRGSQYCSIDYRIELTRI